MSILRYLVPLSLAFLVSAVACSAAAPVEPVAASRARETATVTATATQPVSEAPPEGKPQPTRPVGRSPEREAPTPWPAGTETPARPPAVEPTEAPTPESTPVPTPKPTPVPTPTPPPVLSLPDIVELLQKAMVRIKTDTGTGSGMVISPDGHILTANHVIEGTKEIKVIPLDNKELAGKMLGRDEIRDIGLVKVDGQNLKAVPFGKSEELRVGEEIVTIGFPLDIKGTATVSKGIVSAIRKGDDGITSIQTDAPVNAGNSGGALVNRKGEVVGVITSKYVGAGVEGLAFATAISEVGPVLARLKAGEVIEAPLAKAEVVKKFKSEKFLYSFSYPESWKITDSREDELELSGSDARIYVGVDIVYGGTVYDLGTEVSSFIDRMRKAEPDFKMISNKSAFHGSTGVELVYDRRVSGRMTRVTVFLSQAHGSSRSRPMVYSIEFKVSLAAIKKHQANSDAFFKSLEIAP